MLIKYEHENVRGIKRSKAALIVYLFEKVRSTAVMEKDIITYSPHEFDFKRFSDCVFLKGLYFLRGHY